MRYKIKYLGTPESDLEIGYFYTGRNVDYCQTFFTRGHIVSVSKCPISVIIVLERILAF